MLYAFDKRYGTCKFVWYSVVHTPVNYMVDSLECSVDLFNWNSEITESTPQVAGINILQIYSVLFHQDNSLLPVL